MKVLLFAQLRQVAGADHFSFDGDGLGEAELWDALIARCPALAMHREQTRLARNGVYAAPGEVFRADDEVALIPPVSGG